MDVARAFRRRLWFCLMPLCRENGLTDVLEEMFSVTKDCFFEHVLVDLRPGGSL